MGIHVLNQSFISAAKGGDFLKIKQLLKQGLSPDLEDENHFTVLMHAVQNGHMLVVQILIEAGAFLNKCDYSGKGQTALMLAISKLNIQMIKLLLDSGASVNSIDNAGNSILIYAVHYNCLNLVKTLIEEWAVKINHQNNNLYTAFMIAVRDNFLDIAKYLAEKNADINTRNKLGISPLMHSVYAGHTPMVEFLISLPSLEINLKNLKGNTALMLAAVYGFVHMVAILIKAKALINLQNNRGQTALVAAAAKGHDRIFNMLLKAGADENLKDISGKTAADYAEKQTNIEVISSTEPPKTIIWSQEIAQPKQVKELKKLNNNDMSSKARP